MLSLSLDDFEGEACYLGAGPGQPHRPGGIGDGVPDPRPRNRTDDLHRVCPLLHQRGGGAGGAQPVLSRLGRRRLPDGHARQRDGLRRHRGRCAGDVQPLSRSRASAYDPWQSTQMSQRLRAEGVPMVEFRATTQNFSPAIIEIDAAMRAGRLRHDGNPVLEWCLGNVVGKPIGAATSTRPSNERTRRSTPRSR